MGKKSDYISERQQQFIEKQQLFFVATAGKTGTVNLSPKGMDSLRVISKNKVVWLNLTGSGNETAAHVLENTRITLMFCAFEGAPQILRLYGTAKAYHPRDMEYEKLIKLFPKIAGTRQLFEVSVDLVQSSCGMAVPYYDFKGERMQLEEWAEGKGKEGIEAYWQEKNTVSIDGKSTGIL